MGGAGFLQLWCASIRNYFAKVTVQPGRPRWGVVFPSYGSPRLGGEMFWWVVAAVLLLFVGYVIRTLFFDLDKDENTTLGDFLNEEQGSYLKKFRLP